MGPTLDSKNAAMRALKTSREIQPLLAGLGPDIQGAVLADLVSLWVAGHAPELRETMMHDWFDAMKELIAPSELQIMEQLEQLEQLGLNPWRNPDGKNV